MSAAPGSYPCFPMAPLDIDEPFAVCMHDTDLPCIVLHSMGMCAWHRLANVWPKAFKEPVAVHNDQNKALHT